MNCRKNVKSLSPVEKAALVQAFLDLKDPGLSPSQIPAAQAAGAQSRYDDYVWLHTQIGTGGHRRPGFTPWHRKYLELFEADLQAVSGDPTMALPYWDWADAASNPLTADLLGGSGDGPDNRVTTGAFAQPEDDDGDWPLNVNNDGNTYLRRGHPLNVSQLPDLPATRALLEVTPYDDSPWNDSGLLGSFRNRLEGWFNGPAFHNFVHVWVAGGNAVQGTMWSSDSPNDPVFWLHHCNVDRLWAIWQQKHPGEPYAPDSSEPATLLGHRLGDAMALFGTHFGVNYTIDSVLDHQAGGYWYDTDIPDVSLDTPSVDFGDVPVGATTYHAVRFQVETCREVHFRVTAGPSGNFGLTPLGAFTASPEPGEPFVYGYVFVAYTAPAMPGPTESSSVTIEAYFTDLEGYYTPNPGDDYVLLTVTADLIATPVPRPKAAVALVLDRSGSMAGPAGGSSTKVELLKDAVSVVTGLMRPIDGVAVVSYDDVVDRLLDVTEMGPYMPIAPGSGRAGINAILAGPDLDPRGLTGIGAAIMEGNSALADGQAAANAEMPPDPYDVLAMVVLTDGNENQSPTIDDVAGSISANTFAIGFGTAGNVSEVALEKITKNNNGDMLITGDLSSQIQQFMLTKHFLQVLAGVTNQDIILDPQGSLIWGATHRIGFEVTEADVDLDIVALCPYPFLLSVRLETPDGTVIDPAAAAAEPNVLYVEGAKASFYRLTLPALPGNAAGSHAGRWHAVLTLERPDTKRLLEQHRELNELLAAIRRGLPYSVVVQTRSDLTMTATLSQDSHEPGAWMELVATLREYNLPLSQPASVWADLTRPDGSQVRIRLDEETAGRYIGGLEAPTPGVYTFRVQAAGRTLYGTPFARERTLTGAVHYGGDEHPLPLPPGLLDELRERDERLCRLIRCLLSREGLGPEVWKRLKEWGVDVDALRRCLAGYCRAPRKPQLSDQASWASAGVAAEVPTARADRPTTGGIVSKVSSPAESPDLRALLRVIKPEGLSTLEEMMPARKEEPQRPRRTPADEAIEEIPEEGFYTLPMARDDKPDDDDDQDDDNKPGDDEPDQDKPRKPRRRRGEQQE